MGIGPRSPEPDLLLVCVCVCVCVGTGELISFPSGSLCLPCKGSAKGWRGLADASKLAVLGGLEGGAPHTVQPPREKKKKRKEGASKSFLPGSASSALTRTSSGGTRAASVPTTHSPFRATAEPRGRRCRLRAPPPPPTRPPAPEPTLGPPGQLAVDGRALAGARRRGAAQP